MGYYPTPSSSPAQIPPAAEEHHERLGMRQILASGALLVGIILCVIGAALGVSAAGGAVAGQNERFIRSTATTEAQITSQFALAQQDMQAGNYDLAVQRLQWVATLRPDYPGLQEAIVQSQALLNQGGAPEETLAPSTSEDPETIFAEAQRFFNDKQWANAITRLQEIQTLDPSFRSAEVSEMLYQALVTLGLQYVRGDRLGEGLLLLKQAEAIRPLDDQAAGERNLAQLYVTGRTYETLNWQIAINNFRAIYDTAPEYRDVKERLLKDYVKFGDYLVALGGHCDAAQQYQNAQDIKNNEAVKPKLEAATLECANPTATPTDMAGTPDANLILTGTPSTGTATQPITTSPTP